MSLDQLLGALKREAETEADRLLAEARDAAAAHCAAAEAALERAHEAALGAHRRAGEADLEEVLASARLAARREVLEARAELLSRVVTALITACPGAIDRAEYRATLVDRLDAARRCHDEAAKLVLSAPAALLPVLRELTAEDARIALREDPEGGTGLRLATVDGRLEVADTLEGWVLAHHDRVGRRALQLLGVHP